MVNSTDSNNQPSGYATEYDDMKGSQGVGTYQCLGTFTTLVIRYIFILDTYWAWFILVLNY